MTIYFYHIIKKKIHKKVIKLNGVYNTGHWGTGIDSIYHCFNNVFLKKFVILKVFLKLNYISIKIIFESIKLINLIQTNC